MELDSTGKVVIGKISDDRSIIVVPEGVHTLGESAFRECKGLTSLTLPQSLTSINDFALADCNGLTTLTLPDSCTSIGDYAFAICTGLTSLTLSSSLTSIGKAAFVGCIGLTSLTLPKTLRSVGTWAFARCYGLRTIALPHKLTDIGPNAFEKCTGLTSVTCQLRIPTEFIVWVVSSSRNRDNWEYTTVKYSRNVLKLITMFALERRDVGSVDPGGMRGVFNGCEGLDACYVAGVGSIRLE